MHRRKLLELIQGYSERFPEEVECTARFATFVSRYPKCFENDCWAGHVTGSAWVVDPTASSVLLTHHRKLDRWLQLGGHSDGDPDPVAVATREAIEEGGVSVSLLDSTIFDLDIHAIPERKEDPEHFHFDVRFAFQADSRDFRVSAESNALAWVPIERLRDYTDEESMVRMQVKWLAAARR
jgi:8-oxo-dGTP pyrophosphatase MutT (NUDIX family)